MSKHRITDDDVFGAATSSGKAKPFSKCKPAHKFLIKWAEFGFDGSDITQELEFAEGRKWRFDFAWPSLKVAVEIDGFGFGHQAQQCIANQNEKANAAIELGWVVLRFDSRTLGSHAKTEAAVEQVCRVLQARAETNNH